MASDAMSDDFSAFDLGEFSQDDFAEIDRQIARCLQHPVVQQQQLDERDDGSDVTLLNAEGDSPVRDTSVGRPQTIGKTKNWRRRTRILSVSSVVSPRWCEQQFDYIMRQGLSRTVGRKSISFISGKGKKINVDMKFAAESAARKRRGMVVHRELERETRGEKYRVRPTSRHELFALRLLKMHAAFKSLLENGLTREMPVFGMLNNTVIVGMIDEVVKVELPAVLIGEQTSSTREQDIDFPLPHKSKPSPRRKAKSKVNVGPHTQYTLHLAEIKSRATKTTPADSETVGSREQVMIYRRLLNGLLFTPEPLDFPVFWARIGVDSTAEFSTAFLKQAGILSHNEGFGKTNLDTLVESWELAVERLKRSGVRSVDEKLSLVYRLQHDMVGALDTRSSAGEASPDQDDEGKMDIDTGPGSHAQPRNRLHHPLAPRPPDSRKLPFGAKTTLNAQIKGNSRPPGTTESPQNALPLPPHLNEVDNDAYKFISHKEIVYDEGMVQASLDSTLELLRGEREPLGVPVELAWRCNTCEYRGDCEWREEMAGLAVGRKPKKSV
ncbi:exonuclease V a 5' deoxyribonuclease-domain-containing protein [Ephemerocybe angulata]|uniref:Exonuclease V a 5' deoxyribonuclease-domain-containing protein n=1 Tax=Ephemerocybe angulata TaxID=980116 RepID=A0A8H6LTS0_9AGAR|nr:exonuclease V a 5' deoxyribonuclease-domain-containing protein [Tulosesus angulatus]